MVWIDTHAHLDAAEFGADRTAMLRRARAAGVGCVVIPAVEPANFEAVRQLAAASGAAYALGVHPLFAERVPRDQFVLVRQAVVAAMEDPRFVGIGEIGLDFHAPVTCLDAQSWWYDAQLRLAREFGLAVLLHLRRAQDMVLAGLRRHRWGDGGPGGIAHAFNGSRQQAETFIRLGFRLGFGGTLTYAGSRNIRRLAAELTPAALVLETDAPDMAPVWLGAEQPGQPNEPAQLARIGAVLAQLRGWEVGQAAQITSDNARAALPRLARWLDLVGSCEKCS